MVEFFLWNQAWQRGLLKISILFKGKSMKEKSIQLKTLKQVPLYLAEIKLILLLRIRNSCEANTY